MLSVGGAGLWWWVDGGLSTPAFWDGRGAFCGVEALSKRKGVRNGTLGFK